MSTSTQTFVLLFSFYCQVSAVTFQQSPPQLVKENTRIKINCSHSDSTLLLMLWYQQLQDSLSMTLIGFTYGQNSPTYEGSSEEQFQLTKEDTLSGSLIILSASLSHSAVYFCAASGTNTGYEPIFGPGTKLTVLEHDVKEPKVEILGPSPKECRNEKDHEKKKTLLCVVSEFYPDHISVFWQVNENNVTSGVATDEIAQRDGKFYTMSSRLRVSAEDWFNPENEFKCIVIFFDGENYQRNESTINGEQSTVELNYRDKYLKATQKVKLSYTVFIIKSSIYGAFVAFLVWKLQRSTGK